MYELPPLPFKKVIESQITNTDANFSLIFEKLCSKGKYSKSNKEIYQTLLSFYRNTRKNLQYILNHFHQRMDNIISFHQGQKRIFKNIERIAIGLGIEHPTENGFIFDRNSGIPYLPGTAIKGVCRAMALLAGKGGQIVELFGNDMDGEESFQGDIVFLPAFPEKVPDAGDKESDLIVDVITNHHQSYYSTSSQKRYYKIDLSKDAYPLPLDIESPNPVFHLVIEKGQRFIFRLFSISHNKKNVERAFALLAEALEELGIGARTATGYGRLKCEESDISKKWEVEPMPGVLRTFISYSRKDEKMVKTFVARGGIYGISPWLDQNDLMPALGEDLWETIERGLKDTQVQTLFLSEQAIQSESVKKEIIRAKELSKHIIPVLIDPTDEVKKFLRENLDTTNPLYLKISSQGLYRQWAESIYQHANLRGADKIVLALNHRQAHYDVKLPESWSDLPVIDMRSMEYIKDPSITVQDWNPHDYQEYEDGFRFLQRILSPCVQLYICGYTPLGLAGMIGKYWDRATGARLITWNTYSQEEWSLEIRNIDSSVILPEPKIRKDVQTGDDVAVCHFADNSWGRTQYDEASTWIKDNLKVKTIFYFTYPEEVNQNNFEEVVKKCVASFVYARKETEAKTIHWFAGLPMAVMPHVVFLTRAGGKVIFYDEDKRNHTYIKAFEKN